MRMADVKWEKEKGQCEIGERWRRENETDTKARRKNGEATGGAKRENECTKTHMKRKNQAHDKTACRINKPWV